jgi:hypothetical protein
MPLAHARRIKLDMLDLPQPDLIGMSSKFPEEEVWSVIRSLPPDKAPGPNGFTACFLQVAWHVIRHDLMSAFDAFWSMDGRDFHKVNEAMMTLIPKTCEAKGIKDFRPILLIHVVRKLFSKVLTNRLSPKLNELVRISQSAFIRGRYIQDNFKLVQGSAKLLHARKRPTLLLKIGIARAFDSVAWPFLLEIMEFVGFLRYWRDWTALLLSIASIRILINGNPDDKICHGQGLHQGDPLSPMLFLLVMEALNALTLKAGSWSLLQPPGTRLPHCASLYADDLVIFISLSVRDFQTTWTILTLFEDASDLGCNLAKCQLAPIRYDEDQMTLATTHFLCQLVQFPVKYLGIPLSISKLPRSALQPLLDKVADKLPVWKGHVTAASLGCRYGC